MTGQEIVVVITTCDHRDDADRLASDVVRKRLAACAQVSGTITSYYWWKDTMEEAEEWQIRMKTTVSGYQRLETFIKEHHPYELPQIIAFHVDKVLPEFSQWVAEMVEKH